MIKGEPYRIMWHKLSTEEVKFKVNDALITYSLLIISGRKLNKSIKTRMEQFQKKINKLSDSEYCLSIRNSLYESLKENRDEILRSRGEINSMPHHVLEKLDIEYKNRYNGVFLDNSAIRSPFKKSHSYITKTILKLRIEIYKYPKRSESCYYINQMMKGDND
ncbi:MAG: hypothetical protein ACYCS1_05350 [Gammaproteobacteria bacterium]